ncbi:MAG: protein yceI precursor [Desulfuromonas sp.]|nr:MAG: protein yceI precursor [Desulfuromonas sp.]
MKKMLFVILLLLAMPLSSVFASEWTIDPDHSNAEFRISHLVISEVAGMFPTVNGTLTLDDHNVTASVINVTVDVASLNTGVAKRDAHLLSGDFFDVANYPTMTYASTKIEKNDGGLILYGTLTIRGHSQPAVFIVSGPSTPIKDPWGFTRMGAAATTTINRKDFGMVWNQTLDNGGAMIGEEVTLQIDLELIRQ